MTVTWVLHLRETVGRDAVAGRVIEYGVVLDTDGDRVADCRFAVADGVTGYRAPYREWVTDLHSGRTNEQIGGNYGGIGLDFGAPGEGSGTEMRFFFLTGTAAAPCGHYDGSSTFYAWAAVASDGQLLAVDYAPDKGWLGLPG